jgi:hypothetical protein
VANDVASTRINPFYVNYNLPYPTKLCMSAKTYNLDDDDITVHTSNVSMHSSRPRAYKARAIEHIIKNEIAGGAFRLTTDNAIADSVATQIFIMDGTPVVNKHPTSHPLKVLLADGRQGMSTHMCGIRINGLLVVLTGHIIPDLSIALLFGIRVLTEAGCEVTFTHDECVVRYNNKIILRGEKDPSRDLWTLPLGSQGMTSQHANCVLLSAAPVVVNAHAHPAVQIAFFTHWVRTKANSIRFLHQSLCRQ